MEIMTSLIAAAALVLVAIIETRNGRERKRAQARAERRAEESRLAMDLMGATCKLATVTAKKVTGQHVNGDVESAMETASAANAAYEEFKTRMAATQATKF